MSIHSPYSKAYWGNANDRCTSQRRVKTGAEKELASLRRRPAIRPRLHLPHNCRSRTIEVHQPQYRFAKRPINTRRHRCDVQRKVRTVDKPTIRCCRWPAHFHDATPRKWLTRDFGLPSKLLKRRKAALAGLKTWNFITLIPTIDDAYVAVAMPNWSINS
jgi:hypothetical protein